MAVLLPALAVPASPAALDPDSNAVFYARWSMDGDRNGLDDRLDADLARGLVGRVDVYLHYDRRPTEDDAARVRAEHGGVMTYIFWSYDTIKVMTDYAHVRGMLDIPGVLKVEKFVPPVAQLDISGRAVRARASDEQVFDDIDHNLAVHDTLGLRGEGMVIAVLDSGVDNLHESLDDLDDNLLTLDPKLVQKTEPITGLPLPLFGGADISTGFVIVGCVDPVDDNLHGTHVAGIALGTGGPAGAQRGIAPAAKLVDVDIAISAGPGLVAFGFGEDLGFDFVRTWNAGVSCYGDPGPDRIDVVTMSYGSGGDDPQAFTNRHISDLVRTGVVFVQSAGNAGDDARTLTGGADGGILVASDEDRGTVVRNDDRIAAYSSRGPRDSDDDADALDELRPDIAAPGTNIAAPLMHTQSLYIGLSGTSMAAPTVAGVAALMLQADPTLRPVDLGAADRMGEVGANPVRDLLQQTAQYKTSVDGQAPQFSQPGKFGLPWNNAWGYGLLDAYKAVKAAQQ